MRNNWDIDHFGENIKRSIQDAVDLGDFSSLSRTIRDTVNSALGGGRSCDAFDFDLSSGGAGRNTCEYRTGEAGRGQYSYNDANASESGRRAAETIPQTQYGGLSERYTGTSGKKALAVVLMALGYGLGGIFLLGCAAAAASASLVSISLLPAAAGVLGVCVIPCALAAAAGTRLSGRVKRFRTYVNTIGKAEYCDVRELAEKVMKSEKYVVKDLRKMTKDQWFRQGHLDESGTCLLTTDRSYQDYCSLMRRRREQMREDEERAAAASAAESRRKAAIDPQIREIIRQGEEFITKIRACNDGIPGEEVSAKILRMENLTRRIFARVEEAPETAGDVQKMMDYYLPTAVKLLEVYEEMDRQPVQGENIISSKKEIEDTLDTLNGAFEVLLDDMFQDIAWDVSSDVSVLKTMLAREGLTEKDFKKKV